MDYGSTTTCSSTHKDKHPKRQKANYGDQSIFSKLPEPLITRILSSLSTKDAVRTSVLSKKWRYRWTCITKLDLDDSVLYSRKKGGKQSFINFMYRALLLTDPSIESFSLVIMDNKYDASLVNMWISSVLNRSAKILRIKSHFELSFSALTSHLLFNSPGLEELVLEINVCAIGVPTTSVYFGSLKLLSLYEITFTLDSSGNYSENRTLCFPVLKNFKTINCTWLNAKGITIKAPLLERVLIYHGHDSLSNELDKCATKFYFCASSLKEFTYRGDISQDIVLLDPSSAHNASANIMLYECKDRVEDTGNRSVMLLKQFSQVQYLKFEGLVVLAHLRVADLPSFGILSHLELDFVTCEVLLGLLLKSPILKTLVFKGPPKFDKELLNSASVPCCFLSTLQMVKFAIQGYEHELCFAKFVFENCLVLERMSFSLPTRFRKSKAVDDFKEKLYSFKKGSVNLAIVEFSYDCY